MNSPDLEHMEFTIARCRLALSITAFVVVYVDPADPLLSRWTSFVSGPYAMDPRVFAVMAVHVVYSLAIFFGMRRGVVLPDGTLAWTVWTDLLFGVAVAVLTGGVTGPSYPFFAFAIVTSGLRGGLRPAMVVTTVILALYLCLLVVSDQGSADTYIMRPMYLGITGYLVGYLWQQRLELEDQMRQLEIAEQRHRIGRELHDGYAQALAGINLRLEGSRRLLRADGVAKALDELTDLQASVQSEYDDLRRFARSLAGVDASPTLTDEGGQTRLQVSAEIDGSVTLVEHVFGIAREAVSNVRRHARARSARIAIRTDGTAVHIDVEDDGVGFPAAAVTPWSITSRVREMGGKIEIVTDRPHGAHLAITLPAA
jgi:signal transduction histidine kinase